MWAPPSWADELGSVLKADLMEEFSSRARADVRADLDVRVSALEKERACKNGDQASAIETMHKMIANVQARLQAGIHMQGAEDISAGLDLLNDQMSRALRRIETLEQASSILQDSGEQSSLEDVTSTTESDTPRECSVDLTSSIAQAACAAARLTGSTGTALSRSPRVSLIDVRREAVSPERRPRVGSATTSPAVRDRRPSSPLRETPSFFSSAALTSKAALASDLVEGLEGLLDAAKKTLGHAPTSQPSCQVESVTQVPDSPIRLERLASKSSTRRGLPDIGEETVKPYQPPVSPKARRASNRADQGSACVRPRAGSAKATTSTNLEKPRSVSDRPGFGFGCGCSGVIYKAPPKPQAHSAKRCSLGFHDDMEMRRNQH